MLYLPYFPNIPGSHFQLCVRARRKTSTESPNQVLSRRIHKFAGTRPPQGCTRACTLHALCLNKTSICRVCRVPSLSFISRRSTGIAPGRSFRILTLEGSCIAGDDYDKDHSAFDTIQTLRNSGRFIPAETRTPKRKSMTQTPRNRSH